MYVSNRPGMEFGPGPGSPKFVFWPYPDPILPKFGRVRVIVVLVVAVLFI